MLVRMTFTVYAFRGIPGLRVLAHTSFSGNGVSGAIVSTTHSLRASPPREREREREKQLVHIHFRHRERLHIDNTNANFSTLLIKAYASQVS